MAKDVPGSSGEYLRKISSSSSTVKIWMSSSPSVLTPPSSSSDSSDSSSESSSEDSSFLAAGCFPAFFDTGGVNSGSSSDSIPFSSASFLSLADFQSLFQNEHVLHAADHGPARVCEFEY